MKRYLVFGFCQYYPAGGLGDVSESFDSPAEAIEWAKDLTYDYVVVWDRIDDETLWEK